MRHRGRHRGLALLTLGIATSIAAGGGSPRAAAAAACTQRTASAEYTAAVARATASNRDVWGEQLLARPGGPTYESARQFLAPLLFAQQRQRRPLTPSGVYYLPLSFPLNVYGPATYALHVADGGQIITRRVGGPSLTIRVGRDGSERYGSCLSRLTPATLAEGYLPILRTGYVDAGGVRYQQESFAGRITGSSSVVSLLRLEVDASSSAAGAAVRLVAGRSNANGGDRAVAQVRTRLIGSEGAIGDRQGLRFRVLPGESTVVYAAWLHRAGSIPGLVADEALYETVRTQVQRFWEKRIAPGTTFSVPEPRIREAQRALLIQQVGHTWRYSAGNPYEALSFAEGLDTAEVMASYGHEDVARAILRYSLERLPSRYTAWRTGEHLVAAATYYRLYGDRAFVARQSQVLRRLLGRLEDSQIRSGPRRGRLTPEQLSSDVQDRVDGVTSQLVVWQGLLAMERVWRVTGHPDLARRAARLAATLEAAMRSATRDSARRLPDGSVFMPESLSGRQTVYDRLSTTSEGSYWNLVVPYALASGFFPPGGVTAKGLLRYLLTHGSRLLGVPRADAHIIYGKDPSGRNLPGTSGLGQIYGLSVSRFLADNDEADQLVLSLYGLLAVGMTPDTYVSGEAVSVVPVAGSYYRKTYMPPNSGANSTFLETLRLLLLNERRDARGAPRGLDLAFSTPRAWLADGKEISVKSAPTSFGRVSYSVERAGAVVRARIEPPPLRVPSLRLRLRLPAGEKIVAVRASGRPLPFDRASGTIRLPRRAEPFEIVATVARRTG